MNAAKKKKHKSWDEVTKEDGCHRWLYHPIRIKQNQKELMNY